MSLQSEQNDVVLTRQGRDVNSSRAALAEASNRSTESINSYNPFEHRNVKKPTSDGGALAHLLKTSLGSGILAMPMAFRNAGLLFGAIGTIVIGIVCTHCIQMLVRTSQVLCKRIREPLLSFPATTEMAFKTGPKKLRSMAKASGIIVSTELILSFILGNTVYVVFMAESMKQVVDYYSDWVVDVRIYVLFLWLPLIGICMFRNLKSLVPFSVIANICVVISFSITLYYIFKDINSPGSVNLISDISRIPLFLSTVIFAIEGIGTILPIENEMKNPEHFIGGRCGIVYIAMAIVVSLYSVIGFFGYLEYGEDTKGSITLNLPIDETPAQVVKILIATAIFLTYALQFYVPINMILNKFIDKIPQAGKIYFDLGLRAGLVTITVVTSIAVPNLEPIISLVGSICFSMLGLLIPSVVDTLVRYPDWGRFKWRLVKNVIIGLFSVIALISGTYGSILDIIDIYNGVPEEAGVTVLAMTPIQEVTPSGSELAR